MPQKENDSNPVSQDNLRTRPGTDSDVRVIVIADKKMDWAARLTIASLRIKAKYEGDILMVGECDHPVFDNEMKIDFHHWARECHDLLPDTKWGPFKKPQFKPFIIKKFFKGTTIYLDADTFCNAPIDRIADDCVNWSCSVTKTNADILSKDQLQLWKLDAPPSQQFNSGVLVCKDRKIIDQWCSIFKESGHDFQKYDYLQNKQPWSYDQIALIIAASRTGIAANVLSHLYNFEIASKGWRGSEKASIIHFTNWKIYNFAELQCLSKNAPKSIDFIQIGKIVKQIEDKELVQPSAAPIDSPIRAIKSTSLVRNRNKKSLILGISQGIGNVVLSTPLIKALLSMGWQVDIPAGVFKNGAEIILNKMGVNIVDAKMISSRMPYSIALQSVWPVKGIERLSCQTFYAPPMKQSWENNIFVHEVEANMSLAYAMGYRGQIPHLYCYREMSALTDEFSKITEPLIGLYIRTHYPNPFIANRKLDHPEEIAKRLADQGLSVVLLGGPETKIDTSRYPGNCIDCIGKLTIPQCATIISNLDAFVSEDCGMMHVAAAVGCPQASVFGPTSIVKNRPWSEKAQVIQSSTQCQPCQFTDTAMRCTDNQCMVVDPGLIAAHVKRLLAVYRR